jgi:hypothetical protein
MEGRRRLGSLVMGVLLLAGCAGGGSQSDLGTGGKGGPKCTPPDPTTISFAANIQPIFDTSCALGGCHAGAIPQGELDLSQGTARQQLVGVASMQIPSRDRVVPGDPDASYLVQKIEGTTGIGGVQMPLGCPGAPQNGAVCLNNNQILAIRTWISECASAN